MIALLPGRLSKETCAAFVERVIGARAHWVEAFDGEQFSLGRAFYTHLEEDKTREYFAAAARSDLEVELHLPGLQQLMRDLVRAATGGEVIARSGFCGAGVHIFPAGGEVARRGGVIHFDTEGLGAHHLALRKPAIPVVAMLQPAVSDGGLRVWEVVYEGRDRPTERELCAPSQRFEYAAGDVLSMDSYRLHQIQPFGGALDRISATLHAAEIDPGRWETWF